MLYFSEVYGKNVYDPSGNVLGKLKDFIFLPIASPIITKFVVQTQKKKELIIPIQQLKKHEKGFAVKTATFEHQNLKENEISLLRHVQDKQIMDLKGSKVIRANDVVIQDVPMFAVSGIDIGVIGVFRWIGMAQLVSKMLHTLNIKHKSIFLPWNVIQPLELRSGRIVLKEEKEKLQKLPPEDLADYLEKTTTANALKLLKVMDADLAARIIADIQHNFQIELFKHFSAQKAAQIITIIDPDEAVDILLSLSEGKREEILSLVQPTQRKPIHYLLKVAKTPLGHLMNTDYLTVSSDDTVKHVLSKIKKETQDFPELSYIYAKNKQDQITGVVNIHELVMQDLNTPIYKFMVQHVIFVRLTTPKEIAIKRMLKYHVHSLPVIDENRHIVGVVNLADLTEEVIENELDS